MLPTMTRRYQEGSLDKAPRKTGPDVWVYRWYDADGIRHKKVVGSTSRLRTLTDAKREVESFKAQLNAQEKTIRRLTVTDAWGHFQEHELHTERSPTTINSYLDYFKSQILPTWKDVPLDDVKSVAVEKWLRSLPHAPGTKAKIRNHMSALFNHCIRHELYSKLNPISSVRQSATRQRDPDILTLDEMRLTLANIEPQAIRVMVTVAAASALRRSEIRGLKWKDLDLGKMWFKLERGLVGKDETKLKTKASRKGVPMLPELSELLKIWHIETPYPRDEDWVFASPYTDGNRPYWPESAMQDHIRPAAKKAGIIKHITWHVFRHSFATLMGKEDVKTVQELLRHATSKITLDVYQQADETNKRAALGRQKAVTDRTYPMNMRLRTS
jgi:integrase